MKTEIKLFFFILYLSAFSPLILQMADLEDDLYSYILLLIDVNIYLVSFSSLLRNKFNFRILILMLVMSFFTLIAHEYSFVSHLNGLRELVDIIVIFSFYDSILKTKYKYILDSEIHRFIKVFLSVQIPVSFYQFLKYGAGDYVGGSLGTGNSGVLTLSIILMVFYLIRRNYPKYKYRAYLYTLFLFPVFINETKISFFLIPVMFFLLSNSKKTLTVFVSLIGGVIFFILLNKFYSNNGQKVSNPFSQIYNQEYLDKYIIGSNSFSDKSQQIDIPRFSKIVLALQLVNKNIKDGIFGFQYGAFKGGKVVDASQFSKEYRWLLLGTRPYFFYLLISGGWLLVVIILGFFLKQLCWGYRFLPDKRFSILCGLIVFLVLFYDDSLRSQFFLIVLAYFISYSKGHNKEMFKIKIMKYLRYKQYYKNNHMSNITENIGE